MLYCAAADGCAPVLHDFASSETSVTHSAGAETNASACLVIAPAERGAKASAPSPSTPAAMLASSPPSAPPALSARTVGAAAAEGAEGTAHAAAAEGEAAPAPAPAPAPPFAGHFADPNHPGCPRSISANATAATVSGEDEDGRPWTVRASVASNTAGLATILVDFSPKGGPEALEGTWSGASIAWADGNSWELLTHATTSHCAEYQAASSSPSSPSASPFPSPGSSSASSPPSPPSCCHQ